MVQLAGLLYLLVFCVTLIAGSDQMESHRALRDVSADTDPSSDFWRGVQPVFVERDTAGKLVPGHRTEIRSRWTSGNLYFLFICPYAQLNLNPAPNPHTETNQLWNWDVAEAFIGSDFKNIRRYKEFEISPQSEWVDLAIDLDSPHREDGWLWNSGFQAAARIDHAAKTWYGYMRIPYPAIDPRPATAGNSLRINLFRCQGAGPQRKFIAWQPTHRASFHTPEVFGTLRLVN